MRGKDVQQHVLNVLTEQRQNGDGEMNENEIAMRLAAVVPPEIATRAFRMRYRAAVDRTTLFNQVRTGYILLTHFALVGLKQRDLAVMTTGDVDVRRNPAPSIARATVATAATNRRWRLVLDPTDAANDRAWADALARAGVDVVTVAPRSLPAGPAA